MDEEIGDDMKNICKDYITNSYYKAYDKRYYQVYSNNMLWSSKEPTKEVIEFLKRYDCKKSDLVLDLGCGEGRDAIFLLDNEYNVLAVDYSINVIEKCNNLSNNKYKDSFMQFDIMKDEIDKKFKYIYSIAVLHMFVTDEHRNLFLKFIREHLTDDGVALICVLGDGVKEYSSDITKSFENTKRVVMNNNTNIEIATTSCKIVSWETLEKEIINNDLNIKEKWISKEIPEFTNLMCCILTIN